MTHAGLLLSASSSAAVAIALLALALSIVTAVRQARRYKRLLGAVADEQLRHVIGRAAAEVGPLRNRLTAVEAEIGQLRERAVHAVAAPTLVRFEAYDAGGPALSFSVALVNARRDGVILTALHARDQVRVYAKEVSLGRSPLPLSEEEMRALALAATPEGAPEPRRSARRGAAL